MSHPSARADGTRPRYTVRPCMETHPDEGVCVVVVEVGGCRAAQPTCLNVIHHHSLFILPPSSWHAKANLILGLLIVGAFSQAFFQFTSISSSRRAPRRSPPRKREEILVRRVLIQDWLTTPPLLVPPHTPNLFFFFFLLSVFDELLFPS